LITLPIIAYLLFVTVENRASQIDFVWSPFSSPLHIAFPLVALATLCAGFIWGCVILWSNSFTLRSERISYRREKEALEKQLSLQAAEIERLRNLQKPVAPNIQNMPAISPPEVL
jgi:hypothetical protein